MPVDRDEDDIQRWQLVISRMVTRCSTALPAATLKEPTPKATSSPSALSWNFDQDKIVARDSSMAVTLLVVSCPKEKMAASQVVASYKKLGLVEEAFRGLKTVPLEVRPVYHKTDDRIRSHAFLCTLAYYLQWHLKQRLEPLFGERRAAIRRDKIVLGDVEFEKVTTAEPDQQTILDYLKVRLYPLVAIFLKSEILKSV